MQVLVSGQAGIFAVQTPTGFAIESVATGANFQTGARELRFFFSGCNDIQKLSLSRVEEARSRANLAWSIDRAVRLFIILLDPTEELHELNEVGEALDELLAIDGVVELVERQTFSAPLPEPINAHGILGALEAYPLSQGLLLNFLNHQPMIGRVRLAYDALDENLFEPGDGRLRVTERAIDRGSFRTLVMGANSEGGIEAALFQVYSDLQGIENYREIIKEWTASFERHHYQIKIGPETEESNSPDDNSRPAAVGAAGRQAYERAIQQQSVITDRIRSGDFDTARRFARELVSEQQQTSSPEHIAKTLSSLSQAAKTLDVADLALEWAQQAVEFMPEDALAHAQLADVLMRVGRYAEARQSLDLAQTFGAEGYAASGRARILRYQGQFEDALAAYEKAASEYSLDAEREHYFLAGMAECLRDMERFEEALQIYDAAIEKYPHVAVLHSGRAATLVDMGCYQEALRGYRTALNLDSNDRVPRNGIASLYSRAGYFEEAAKEFRSTIADYPFDIYSRAGLVKALRELGRHDDALSEAQSLVKYRPASPGALWVLADAQIDAGDFDGALNTLNHAVQEYPQAAGLNSGFARLAKAQGRYSEALALFDAAARKFPTNERIELGRAGILRRLGRMKEAQFIYERSLVKNPNRIRIKNALASVYIYLGNFDEAAALLTVNRPRTAEDWRNFAIKGMLHIAMGEGGLAKDRFQWGIEHCPFRRERQLMQAALGRLQIEDGEPEIALETVSDCASSLFDLIRLHASAAANDNVLSEQIYGSLLQGPLPEPYHDLRDEIAGLYNVVTFQPRHDLKWVLNREAEALLLEAA